MSQNETTLTVKFWRDSGIIGSWKIGERLSVQFSDQKEPMEGICVIVEDGRIVEVWFEKEKQRLRFTRG